MLLSCGRRGLQPDIGNPDAARPGAHPDSDCGTRACPNSHSSRDAYIRALARPLVKPHADARPCCDVPDCIVPDSHRRADAGPDGNANPCACADSDGNANPRADADSNGNAHIGAGADGNANPRAVKSVPWSGRRFRGRPGHGAGGGGGPWVFRSGGQPQPRLRVRSDHALGSPGEMPD